MMKPQNERLKDICITLENIDSKIFDCLDKRNDIQDYICEFLNKNYTNPILELGFVYAHYIVEEYEIISNIILYFEEKKKRGDFDSEEDWVDYQNINTEKCYDYFDIAHPHLDISCFPMDEEI